MSKNEPQKITLGMRFAFANGDIGDTVAQFTFQFLVFTFYFTVVKLPVMLVSLGFVLWSAWNAFNDPMIGYLSDRTKTRWGRRVPWMMGAAIPLVIVMILLFTPPLSLHSDIINFIYLLIILISYDTVFTSFNLNYNALFSEMFVKMEDRSKIGRIRISLTMIATILAFVMPTLIIEDLTNRYNRPETLIQYQMTGVIAAMIMLVSYSIILK